MPGAVVPGLTSVVVVAADSGPLLRCCVAAAFASTAPVEVIVVDNASTDGEPGRLPAGDPDRTRLILLREAANRGFGPACNRGAAAARGDGLLFVNPDAAIPADAVARLRAIAAADPRIGVLGALVRNPDGSARASRRREPSLRRALLSLSGVARLASPGSGLAGVEIDDPVADGAVETVAAVSGACLYLPRAAFERVGGFDEGYFLHCEDLDLCRRVRDAGLRVAVAHDVVVEHAQGSSSRHRPVFVSWHKHRGMWRYFHKFDPAARNPVLATLVRTGIWTHFLAGLPKRAIAVLIARFARHGRI
jgi:GT2 family glycosyltransferase